MAGVLLATTREASQGHELRDSAPTRLSDLVRDAQRSADLMQGQRDQLTEQRDTVQQQSAEVDGGVAAAVSAIEGFAEPGGLTAVTGTGLTVTLTDAPRDNDGNFPVGASPDDLVVHQQDLQSVLNALWAGGAEAVEVMDQRIITTSAPRCIGNTLLLHGRAYSPPYVMSAIGDVERMQAALDAEPGVRLYQQYADRYGLGYEVVANETVDIGAYTGPLRARYAELIEPLQLPGS